MFLPSPVRLGSISPPPFCLFFYSVGYSVYPVPAWCLPPPHHLPTLFFLYPPSVCWVDVWRMICYCLFMLCTMCSPTPSGIYPCPYTSHRRDYPSHLPHGVPACPRCFLLPACYPYPTCTLPCLDLWGMPTLPLLGILFCHHTCGSNCPCPLPFLCPWLGSPYTCPSPLHGSHFISPWGSLPLTPLPSLYLLLAYLPVFYLVIAKPT